MNPSEKNNVLLNNTKSLHSTISRLRRLNICIYKVILIIFFVIMPLLTDYKVRPLIVENIDMSPPGGKPSDLQANIVNAQ